MKHLLLTTIAALLLVGCGESTVKSVYEISVDEILRGNSEASLGLMDEILKGNIEGVKQYLAAGAVVNEWVWIRAHGTSQLPLNLAVQEGHKKIVELIIAKGTDVNAKGGIRGRIPLHVAAMEGYNEIAELLIAKGADVNAKSEGGGTPLHGAAEGGHEEIIELLIANGADVKAKDDLGYIPLHGAASKGRKEVVELLIAKGADVNAISLYRHGQGTPLDWAMNRRQKETADLLRKHGGKTGEELKAEGK